MTVYAFWSYRREDDRRDKQKIIQLAEAVKEEFEALRGEQLVLFLDRDSIAWGDNWNTRIANAVNEATYFIPILTPGYFISEKCREEFRSFVAKSRQLGATERILGILYINVPNMTAQASDDLVAWASKYQNLDLTAIRWCEVDSMEFRREANRVARLLVDLESASTARTELVAADTGAPTNPPGPQSPAHGQVRRSYLGLVGTAESVVFRILTFLKECESAVTALRAAVAQQVDTLEYTDDASAKVALLAGMFNAIQTAQTSLDAGVTDLVDSVENVDSCVQAVLSWPTSELIEVDMLDREKLTLNVDEVRRQTQSVWNEIVVLQDLIERTAKISKVARATFTPLETSIVKFADAQRIIERWNTQNHQ